MGEIKINLIALDGEICTFRSAGDNISTSDADIDSSGVNTLETCLKYIEQQKKIALLLDVCKNLVIKDAGDVEMMKGTVAGLDAIISSVFHK